MVRLCAPGFNTARVAKPLSDCALDPLRARATYAGGMLDIAQEIREQLDQASEPRRLARSFYFQGWRISAIARRLGVKRSTVNSWKQRDQWEAVARLERVEIALESRIVGLIAKEVKNGGDFKEIDLLMRAMAQAARVRRYEQPGGHEGDLNPKLANRNAGPKKKPSRNAFSEEQQGKLIEAFKDSLFDYQKVWYRNGDQRTRAILKSRQIGAT